MSEFFRGEEEREIQRIKNQDERRKTKDERAYSIDASISTHRQQRLQLTLKLSIDPTIELFFVQCWGRFDLFNLNLLIPPQEATRIVSNETT
jgi:hypothetical protein